MYSVSVKRNTYYKYIIMTVRLIIVSIRALLASIVRLTSKIVTSTHYVSNNIIEGLEYEK